MKWERNKKCLSNFQSVIHKPASTSPGNSSEYRPSSRSTESKSLGESLAICILISLNIQVIPMILKFENYCWTANVKKAEHIGNLAINSKTFSLSKWYYSLLILSGWDRGGDKKVIEVKDEVGKVSILHYRSCLDFIFSTLDIYLISTIYNIDFLLSYKFA